MSQVYITHTPRPWSSWQDAKIGEVALTQAAARLFWAKVERGPGDACWRWTASVTGGDCVRGGAGYGQFGIAHPDGTPQKRQNFYAHRVAWALAHGSLSVLLSVLHHCDNRLCVNPAHLFLGTQLDNMRDASAKGRLSLPRVKNRLARDAARVRWQQGGVTQRQLATEYGVDATTMGRWLKPRKQAA